MANQEHPQNSPEYPNSYSNDPQYPGSYGYGYGPHRPEDDDEIDLHALFLTLLRRKWSVISLITAGILIAALTIFTTQPVYESEGTIVITEQQQRSSAAGSDLQNLLNTSYGIGLGSTIANEILVIKSRQLSQELAERVISQDVMEDGQRFPILWREYEGVGPFPLFWRTIQGDSSLATREQIARRIRNRIEVERAERDANVVRVTFESPSPFEAKWMVDQIIDTYIEFSGEQNRTAASSALEFLERERTQVEEQLAESEERLKEFMDNTGLVQIDAQTGSVINRISELESRRQEIRTNLVAIESAIETQEQRLDQIMPGLADRYAENVAPTLTRYQNQLAELEAERLLLVTRNPALQENPEAEPQLVRINSQIDALKEEINRLASQLATDEGEEFMAFLSDADGNVTTRVSQIRSQLIELQLEQAQMFAQQQAIDERLQAENTTLDNLPENMTQIARLRRDVQINEQLYESITAQYAETARWEQTQYGQGRPLDYGVFPDRPNHPRKAIFLLIGLMLGGISGVGLALTRERLNNQIDGAEKLKSTGATLLSVIPEMDPFLNERYNGYEFVRKNGSMVSANWISFLDVNSPVSEAYRRLQNNIIYSHPDKEFRTIMVTSTAKGEGKTTTSVNLATILAETGKKVLLIDSDLRMPFTHRLTGLKRSPGLVEVLFDDLPVENVIQKSSAPNVDVLTAGSNPHNPSSAIHSQKLKNLVEEFKEQYDHIIFDTPPYGIVTDAAPLMQLSDGVVVVVKFGQTRLNELNQTLENLHRIKAEVLGAVITRYRFEESDDYYSNGYNQYYYSYRAYEEYQSNREEEHRSPNEDSILTDRDPPAR